jgi:hypothetical protein
MFKFKIGDKVMVVETTACDEKFGVDIGMVGVVRENSQFPFVSFPHGEYPCYQNHIELVEETKTAIASGVKRQCLDIAELLGKKDKDYDSAFSKSYKEFGMTSVSIRLNDKVERLKNLVKGKEPNFESIDDTLMDIAGYAILALVERQED